jgi:hypothetical protein
MLYLVEADDHMSRDVIAFVNPPGYDLILGQITKNLLIVVFSLKKSGREGGFFFLISHDVELTFQSEIEIALKHIIISSNNTLLF